MTDLFLSRLRDALALLLTLGLLAGCSVQRTYEGAALDTGAGWVLLPVINLAQSPQAGERTEAILASLVRARGLTRLAEYPRLENDSSWGITDDQQRFNQAHEWARTQPYRFALTGSVEEWRYKSGLDGEPAVGFTLKVLDLRDGSVVWTATGARTGWGREGVAGAAHRLLGELVDGLPLQAQP